MNVKDLLRAFGDIDDKYIIEQCDTTNSEKYFQTKSNVIREKFKRKEVIVMDRRIFAIVLIMILVILSFTIINKKEENTTITELVQIANPLIEVNSLEEMKKYLGFDVPLLDKDVESYIVIGENQYATHARIVYQDDTQFEMEKGNSDVSGIYGGTLEMEETIDNVKVQFYSYEDIKYVIWQKDGYSYSYSNNNGEVNRIELEKLLK